MKRKIYYLTFTLLGAMFGFLTHALVEVCYIKLLLADFEKYGLGWSWEMWEIIHQVGIGALIVGFSAIGYSQGVKWWRILYVQKRYLKRWGINLKENF
jgi:hypothetical protein